jgi:hypothetical protein
MAMASEVDSVMVRRRLIGHMLCFHVSLPIGTSRNLPNRSVAILLKILEVLKKPGCHIA